LLVAGDRQHESIAWNNLGSALQDAGQVDEAVEAYGKSLEIRWEFEDWYGAGLTYCNLAVTYEVVHGTAEARTAYLQAAEAFTRANAPDRATAARTRAAALEANPPLTP